MTAEQVYVLIQHRVTERVMGHRQPADATTAAFIGRIVDEIIRATITETIAELEARRPPF